MEQDKLKQFNEELTTLLTKHNVTLNIEQRIVVTPLKKMEEETNIETVEETPEDETVVEEVAG